MTTVLLLERHPVHPDHRDDYAEMLSQLAEAARTSPGALWADVGEAFDDPPSFLLVSEWRTPADADAWQAGDAYTALVERADAWLREGPFRRRFAST